MTAPVVAPEAEHPEKAGKGINRATTLPTRPKEIESLLRRPKRNQRKAWAEGYMTAIRAMLRPGDLAIDCGANMGVVTAVLAATGADVIAHEPDPFAFATLHTKFCGMPNVTLVNAAVGAGAGSVRLMRADNFSANPDGASVKSTIIDGGRRIDAENSVEVALLDFPAIVCEKVAARGEIAFVKMDIEGAELEILEIIDREGLFTNIRALVAETHERKLKICVTATRRCARPWTASIRQVGSISTGSDHCPTLNGAIPARASSSARSFSACPAWPLIQRHSTLWRARAASSLCHRSTFFTGGPPAVRQPLRFQPSIQSVMPFFT